MSNSIQFIGIDVTDNRDFTAITGVWQMSYCY